MNALSIYLSTCRYVLQIDPGNEESWQDLYRYLPYLRQALTCCVCGGILRQPVSPVNVKSCQHHVCKQCVGGKMKVRPSCSWCKEWDQFVENIQLRIILQCFKELCSHLLNSSIYTELTTSHHGAKYKIAMILEEGLTVEDYKYPAKNKFSNISNWPLPHFTFLSATSSGSSNSSSIGQSKQSDADISTGEGNTKTTQSKQSETSNKDVSSPVQTEEVSCEPVFKLRRFSAPDMTTPKQSKSDFISGIPNFYSKRVKNPSESSATDAGNGSSDSRTTVVTSEGEETKTDNDTKKSPSSGQTKRMKHPSEPTRKGCRCGTANVPNKLTCYCQRCPCYSQRQGCFGCKCRGCRNPYNKRKPAVPADNTTCQEVNVET